MCRTRVYPGTRLKAAAVVCIRLTNSLISNFTYQGEVYEKTRLFSDSIQFLLFISQKIAWIINVYHSND